MIVFTKRPQDPATIFLLDKYNPFNGRTAIMNRKY